MKVINIIPICCQRYVITMLTGYMPDYTCLVTPIFRAYEFFLHRILGDVMELETENDKGNNKFSYFSKNDVGNMYAIVEQWLN